ncbi:hypothetical protein CcaverHIS002_0102600 [Cutaneotrichosporon cavernicola]|uniref:Uncharacterized protein n=1 Tax=Cutaneotrichosporon cavernicola TaxID=279322 RepID=A0AA48HXY2_9TREE|nr:uncharacterized protein CcaverHIS019_0102540 [Cutaneotrichosporon cavernicola]BEI79731.1 hypothetical protein CcaverHIS002_0102600 [Cutaneotrichosporon cavernicola]BEI87536.1 hypothetical protein CcaverHIS019_0102540 [Cutaneotrichosporon cavernicola]BEI95308.1 hypothetical protein CcaverHIS631_0102570 [Cutaneotrichosporon cavernicola]BEJ03081.1 hypothetical protein CcaverHIS641_0102560 [Cutaneotrichosporon cavernicola]
MNTHSGLTPKKTVRFAPDTKVIDTSDISANKYRRLTRLAPRPQPKPTPRPQFQPDLYEAVASRERIYNMSRSWMY